ncbi:MAG TPA: DUF1499 domain-containing protein [Dongiaceae bacterium]|nr:DUF1499 domain-containing protein [Dongiaceae bacterium]
MTHINRTIVGTRLLLTLGLFMVGCNGAPVAKGVAKGYVAGCPATGNCISSQTTRSEQKIAPLAFTGNRAAAMEKLKAVLAKREDTKIVQENSDYLHVEFTMKWTGLIDDGEFLLTRDAIQLRSASRSGSSDFGKNRERIEEIRAAFSPCCK